MKLDLAFYFAFYTYLSLFNPDYFFNASMTTCIVHPLRITISSLEYLNLWTIIRIAHQAAQVEKKLIEFLYIVLQRPYIVVNPIYLRSSSVLNSVKILSWMVSSPTLHRLWYGLIANLLRTWSEGITRFKSRCMKIQNKLNET